MAVKKQINVLITGSTDGIGLAITKRYLEDESCIAYGAGRNNASLKRLKNKYGSRFVSLQGDLLNASDLKELAGHIETSKIDVLINNAGINRIDDIDKTKDKNWDDIINLNLTVPMKLIRAAAPGMKIRKFGRIVNIGSIFGNLSFPKRAVYSSSKSGLNGLTKGVALDLAPYGILVNSISPGFTITKLTQKVLGEKGMKRVSNEVPMQRMAKPSEIAEVVYFFGSKANSYTTGQDIIVDGGYAVK